MLHLAQINSNELIKFFIGLDVLMSTSLWEWWVKPTFQEQGRVQGVSDSQGPAHKSHPLYSFLQKYRGSSARWSIQFDQT